MQRYTIKPKSRRSQSGVLASLLLVILLLAASMFAAFAVDIGHAATVRTELQNAIDASALAGARNYVNGFDYSAAYNDALSMASKNTADGLALTSSNSNTKVSITALNPADEKQPGVCQVMATMNVPTMLAKLFGQETTPVTVTAKAQGYSSINAVAPNVLFPLAVSVDTITGHHKPLYKCGPGEEVTFFINTPKLTNAMFTGFTNEAADSNYINEAIEQQLSLAKDKSTSIPSVKIGDRISLLRDTRDICDLSAGAEGMALLNKGPVILPLISGDGPFNQSRPVDGFVAVRITNVERDLNGRMAIKAVLVKTATKGHPGSVGTPTGIPTVDAGIQRLSPGIVMLSPMNQIAMAQTEPGVIENNYTAAPNASGPTTTVPGNSLSPNTGSAISGNFNRNSTGNASLWFDALLRIANNPNQSGTTTINFTGQTVTFTADGKVYRINIPNAKIILSNQTSVPSTTFDSATQTWVTRAPSNYSEGIFLSGMPYTANLPGGIQNVLWNGTFSSDVANLSLDWQWGAAAYSNLSNNLNALGVAASGDNAGTPSNYTAFLQPSGGGTSSGGTNTTGSFSNNSTVVPTYNPNNGAPNSPQSNPANQSNLASPLSTTNQRFQPNNNASTFNGNASNNDTNSNSARYNVNSGNPYTPQSNPNNGYQFSPSETTGQRYQNVRSNG